jgi:hypothetical protein
MFTCVCGKEAKNTSGLMLHQKFCQAYQKAEVARMETAARGPDPSSPEAEVAKLRNLENPPQAAQLHEDALEDIADPEDDDDAASKIGRAIGDRLPDPLRAALDAKKPAGVTLYGDDSKDADKPPVTPREELDALSQRLGAEFFRAGTENRFKWCREFHPDGPRHTFSRLYAKERVLVDVYAERSKLVAPEVESKIAAIQAHNELEPGDRWGYLAYVIREGIPSVDACRRALAGECVPLAPKPTEKITLAQIAS